MWLRRPGPVVEREPRKPALEGARWTTDLSEVELAVHAAAPAAPSDAAPLETHTAPAPGAAGVAGAAADLADTLSRLISSGAAGPSGAGARAPEGVAVVAPRRQRRVTWQRVVLVIGVVLLGATGFAYSHKAQFSAQGADLSRRVIGDERTARVEGFYFKVQDRIDRTKYRLVGGKKDPFATGDAVVQFIARPQAEVVNVVLNKRASVIAADPYFVGPPAPDPMRPPKTTALHDTPDAGEGVWTTAGLPRSTPNDMLLAKTFIHPDKARPYATVGVLLMDSRRIRLHLVGGTVDPGGDRGVKGPGVIPQADMANLIAAWNGGFKGPHGGFGMVADGKEYRPLRNGLASIAVFKDGAIKMGEWGADLKWDDNMVAVRQNVVLLVKDGEVSKRVSEGNDTWGYVNVNSAEFITWRSAVGLTKDGNLLFAAGNSLSAESLAKALWAAGAYTAMQLDINTPYVLLGTFFPQADGTLRPEKFMDTMSDSATRFFKTQERDFMYITLDEQRYRASALR